MPDHLLFQRDRFSRLALSRAAVLLAMLALSTISATIANAATPAYLIGEDLQPRKIFIQSLGEGFLTYFDENRNLQARRVNEFLAIRFDPSLAEAEDAPPMLPPLGELGVVHLTDGQKLVGEVIVDDPASEGVRIRSSLLGSVDIDLPLERVSFISRNLDDRPSPNVVGDQLTLSNGDVVAGFVESVTDAGWRITPEGAENPLTLPHRRVAKAQLANPMKIDSQAGYMVHVYDGSVLLCEEVGSGENTLSLRTALAGPVEMFIAWIERVDLPTKVGRLVPLTSLNWRQTAGGEVFGLRMPPLAAGNDLKLHAPVTITLDLPDGARRFAATAHVDASSDAAEWTDMVVILRVDSKERVRRRLNAAEPEQAINIPLAGLEMSIEVDPSVNGPIMDRLLLEQPVVLIRE